MKVRPAAILLDLMMPVMDGYGFLEARAQDPELASVPVAVVTAGHGIDRAHRRRHTGHSQAVRSVGAPGRTRPLGSERKALVTRPTAGGWRGTAAFRLLVASVKDYAIFMLDPSGRVATWNAGAERIKGYRPDEIIGKHFSIFYPPEDSRPGKPQALLEVAAREGRVEDEGWRVRKDGSRFWARRRHHRLRDATAGSVGFAKVTRDLTARTQAEEALRQSEERFAASWSERPGLRIFMLDPDGRVATWNAGAERIKGYRAEEIIGQHFSRFYPPEDIAREQAPARELEIAAREGRYEEEGWRVRKDGSRFWASVVIAGDARRTGRLLGFAKVTRDLTDRRKTEEERLRLVQAREAIRLRDEFLSIASHELKTPLAALLLLLGNMQGRIAAIDEHLAKSFERATRIGARLGQLVDALLDVSRIATGKLSLNLEPFDLGDSRGR